MYRRSSSGRVYLKSTAAGKQFAVQYCFNKQIYSNEIRFLRALRNCVFVPRLVHSYKAKDFYIIITEFTGTNNGDYTQALQAVHDQGVLHGHVNAGSFIKINNKVYIVDFGFASTTKTSSKFASEMMLLNIFLKNK